MFTYDNKDKLNFAFHLKVDSEHELYIEDIGNKEGIPIIFLHGGPGGGIDEKSRSFFNPDKFHVILFEQRGVGRSKPFLSLKNNTVLDSVSDIEKIREHYGIDKWYVFGGSYGSTLALTYAIHHPERCLGLILRGIFLGRKADIDWLYNGGAGQFYPEEFQRFKNFIPKDEQNDLVDAYYKRLRSNDEDLRLQAAKHWSDWENGVTKLMPRSIDYEAKPTKTDLQLALMEAHYFANRMFWYEDNYILNRSSNLEGIHLEIFHGRYDVDCRPSGAFLLSQAVKSAHLNIIEASGHSGFEQNIYDAIVKYLDEL